MSPYGWAICPFCDRTIGTQSGRLRTHKFSNEIPVCPASGLSHTKANALFSEAQRRMVANAVVSAPGPRKLG